MVNKSQLRMVTRSIFLFLDRLYKVQLKHYNSYQPAILFRDAADITPAVELVRKTYDGLVELTIEKNQLFIKLVE